MIFKSLTEKLMFVGIIALLFTTFYVSSEFIFTEQIRGEATRINIAGHLRFRSFKIAWLLHRMIESKRPELRETVIDEIKTFESIAGTLRSGRKDIGVKAAADMDEMMALDGILNNWNSGIKPMVLDILERPDNRARPMLDRYDSLISDFVTEINGFVKALEEHFKERIRRFKISRAYVLGLFIIVSSFIALYIRRGIIKPLDSVFETTEAIAGGDFKRRLDVRTGDEIGRLADSINSMALGIEGAIVNLEGLVQQRTEELAVANEEITFSNKELQAAYARLEEANQDLAVANEELRSLDKLKTEFLQTISHELRSPITPILGYLEMMKEGEIWELSEKQREVVEEMHLCGKNMQFIVGELLEVAAIQAGRITLEMEDTDICSILRHAVNDVRKHAEERRIEIVANIPSGPFSLAGDRERLSMIFIHLMRNAIKFTMAGGMVRVEASAGEDGFEVSVSDTGVGIPKDKLEKIFEGFYQADSSATRHFEGVGLGLYLVKRLVELHNGHIGVESEAGNGTTFKVFFPKVISSGTGFQPVKTGKMPVQPDAEAKGA